MAIKSNNTHGNPYHDESNGQFTESDNKNTKKYSYQEEVLKKLNLNVNDTNNHFDFSKNSIAEILPKTTLEGLKRFTLRGILPDLRKKVINYFIQKQQEETSIKSYDDSFIDTSSINTPIRQAMRNQMVDDMIAEQSNQREIRNDYEATIIIGLPASGKSTLTDLLKAQKGAFEVDSDMFTVNIPEFQKDPSCISSVHREATGMTQNMMNKIGANGSNMIIGKVGGGDAKYFDKFLDQLGAMGYKINVILNDLPVDKAYERNIQRHNEGNPRVVPFSVFAIADYTLPQNFEHYLQHKNVVGGSIYSNDVPRGEQPILLKEFKKGF